MKVLLANKFFYLNGGSETVFFQEREFLKGRGIEVVDFSMQDPRNRPSEYSGRFVPHLDFRNGGGFGEKVRKAVSFVHSAEALRRVRELAAEERPDVAHLHNIYHQLTPAIIPELKRRGARVVLTLHDGKLVCPSYLMLDASKGSVCADCGGRSFYRAVSRRCQGSAGKGLLLAAEAYWHRLRRSYDGVDLFLAPSRFLADLMTSRRLPGARVRVLRNGIDTSRYLPSRRDEGYALYFGRLSREKGVETLLRAHAAHASRVPLKVVGTGPLEAELRARFPAAEFLGYRTGRVLEKLVSDSSCVVVPSEWYENCSMVVLEAMAFGKPVIGSRMGGIPEQVEDGVTGYLFPMGDEQELAQRLLRLWDDPSLRGAMGAAGRAKLEREYSLERHCAELLSIYRDLMEA